MISTTRPLILALSLAATAGADPAVIGRPEAARPVEASPAIPVRPAPKAGGVPPTLRRPGPVYPVRTPGLGPGRVEPQTVSLPQLAGRPLFLVGSDEFSKAWLARYRDRLRAIGAAGLLVQADTAADLQAVEALAPDLPIAALDASETARLLGLTHYPVLISAERIEQ
jgi:integrating conjugative element protein (TIGR03765 family)